MAIGLVWHERYGSYDSGNIGALERAHALFDPLPTIDNPVPKVRAKRLLDRAGVTERLVAVEPRHATEEELLRVHDGGYLKRMDEMSQSGGGDGGDGAPFGPGDFETAKLSAGGCLAAIDAVMTGRVDKVFALVHPPGHHARPSVGTGFCVLANGPLAAIHARVVHGLRRIAIIDWDVHHGNSAQEVFWTDPGVLAISIHQAECFPPASGGVDEIGEGEGEGYTLNIPLPPGSGEAAYRSAMEQVVLPALRAFRPELILVACGFDAGFFDPLGRMCLGSDSFRWLMERTMDVAEELCAGRIVVTQEGGYDPSSVPFHALATVEALAGIVTGVDNPFAGPFGGDDVRPHEASAVAAARENVLRYEAKWKEA